MLMYCIGFYLALNKWFIIFDYLIYVEILPIVSYTIFLAWIYSIGNYFYNQVTALSYKSFIVFKLEFLFIFIITNLSFVNRTQFFISQSIEQIMSLISLCSILYCFYFVANIIRTIELKKKATIFQTISFLFLFVFSNWHLVYTTACK